MGTGVLRLLFAGVWLVVAVGLFAREWLGRVEAPAARSPQVAGLLALAFAVWNVARWRQARLRQVVGRSRPRPAGGEYHPAFDFGGSPDRSPKR